MIVDLDLQPDDELKVSICWECFEQKHALHQLSLRCFAELLNHAEQDVIKKDVQSL